MAIRSRFRANEFPDVFCGWHHKCNLRECGSRMMSTWALRESAVA